MTVQNRHAFRLHSGLRRGLRTEVPLPTRLVSNEEFPPLPQTAAQRQVEQRILSAAGQLAPRLGLSRRDFLRTSGGMATSLLAMNAVFGRFFDVAEIEAAEPSAFQERRGEAVFIFDVQLHYVGAGYDPENAEAQRSTYRKFKRPFPPPAAPCLLPCRWCLRWRLPARLASARTGRVPSDSQRGCKGARLQGEAPGRLLHTRGETL